MDGQHRGGGGWKGTLPSSEEVQVPEGGYGVVPSMPGIFLGPHPGERCVMTGLLHLLLGASRCTAPPGPSVRLPLSDLQKAVFHPAHECDGEKDAVQYLVISL